MKRRTLQRLLYGNLLVTLGLAGGAAALTGCQTRNPMQDANTQPDVAPPPVLVPAPPHQGSGTANGTDRQDNTQPANPPANTAPVTATLTTDKTTYDRGETVNLTITAHNNTNDPQTLQFYSGQIFEITARPENQANNQPQTPTEATWRWSQGKMFIRNLSRRSLAAGASQSWTATWDQTSNNHVAAPRGRYILQAQVVANKGIDAPPVTIELQD
ncbi:MAG: hypothetical protein JO316_20220 [Abitibacteriaceae bacterium]|nr:hypothetical protein [Abditibacteriaceae bacterium]MBV9867684.1 hypothetical protein [Abditibacteriaceae bacterium]